MTIDREHYPDRGGGLTLRAVVAAACAVLLALLVLLAVAPRATEAAVKEGRTIEVFHGIEFVGLAGYPANQDVLVEVVRNGVVIGQKTMATDGQGVLEINHVGGADCWEGVTPDILPGDTVRTTVVGDPTDVDTSAVRDIFIDLEATAVDTAANTITMNGHVRSLDNAPIDVANDVLELRLNADGFTWDANNDRRDLRENVAPADFDDGDADPTTFTHVFSVSDADADNAAGGAFEQAFEWSAGAGAEEEVEPSEITVYDGSALEAGDCPPRAQTAMTDVSHEVINAATIAGGESLTVGGPAQDGITGVGVELGGKTYTATPSNGLWTITVGTADLETLPQGDSEIVATFQGAVAPASQTRTIHKDTVSPANPTATPGAGTYDSRQSVTLSAEDGATIHYTVNGATPTANSRAFGDPIPVTASQTIRAIAVDGAGNPSGVGTFEYVVRGSSFVSLDLRSTKMSQGRTQTIRGRVFPAHPDESVRLSIERKGRTVLERNLALGDRSTYRFRYKPKRPGRYFVQARFAGDADHAASTSATKSFRVIRRR